MTRTQKINISMRSRKYCFARCECTIIQVKALDNVTNTCTKILSDSRVPISKLHMN